MSLDEDDQPHDLSEDLQDLQEQVKEQRQPDLHAAKLSAAFLPMFIANRPFLTFGITLSLMVFILAMTSLAAVIILPWDPWRILPSADFESLFANRLAMRAFNVSRLFRSLFPPQPVLNSVLYQRRLSSEDPLSQTLNMRNSSSEQGGEDADLLYADMIHPDTLEEFYRLFGDMRNEVHTSSKSSNGTKKRLQDDICFRLYKEQACYVPHGMRFWNNDVQKMREFHNHHKRMSMSFTSDMHETSFEPGRESSISVDPYSTMSGFEWNSIRTKILHAKALKLNIILNASDMGIAEDWSNQFIKHMRQFQDGISSHSVINKVSFISELAISAEISSKALDVNVPAAVVCVILAVLCIMVTNLFTRPRPPFDSFCIRWLILFVGTLFIAASFMEAILLSAILFAIPITPTSVLALVICAALGIDSILFLQCLFRESCKDTQFLNSPTNMHWEKHVISCFLDKYWPRAYSSLVWVSLSALSCLFCTIVTGSANMMILSLLVQTFFGLILGIAFQLFATSSLLLVEVYVNQRIWSYWSRCDNAWLRVEKIRSFVQRCLTSMDSFWTKVEHLFFRSITHPLLSVIIVAITMVVTLLCILSIILVPIQLHFSVKDMMPKDSYVSDYWNELTSLEGGLTNFGALLIRSTDEHQVDFASKDMQVFLTELHGKLQEQDFLDSSSTQNWFSMFISWLTYLSPHASEFRENNHIIPSEKYSQWADEFLSGMGEPLTMTVARSENASGSIDAMYMLFMGKATDRIETWQKQAEGHRHFVSTMLRPELNITSQNIISLTSFDVILDALRDPHVHSSIQLTVGTLILSLTFALSFIWQVRKPISTVYAFGPALIPMLTTIQVLGIMTWMGVSLHSMNTLIFLVCTSIGSAFMNHMGLAMAGYIICSNASNRLSGPQYGHSIGSRPMITGCIAMILLTIPLVSNPVPMIQTGFFVLPAVTLLVTTMNSLLFLPCCVTVTKYLLLRNCAKLGKTKTEHAKWIECELSAMDDKEKTLSNEKNGEKKDAD